MDKVGQVVESKEERISKLIEVFEKDYPNLLINDKIRCIKNLSGNEYTELIWYYKRIRAEKFAKDFSETLKGLSYEEAIKEVKDYTVTLEQKAMSNEL